MLCEAGAARTGFRKRRARSAFERGESRRSLQMVDLFCCDIVAILLLSWRWTLGYDMQKWRRGCNVC